LFANEQPRLWLYRGAWQEWGPEEVDMAVPLSPEELKRKRYAIFRYQSQKDRAMFPGPYDDREFWQRAEERNITTAKIYDALGLPEYHAMESFVRLPLEKLVKDEQPRSQ
jgi:glucosamine-6-phosphate deaminase